ncbi:hypothetical protein ACSAZK_03745 [Methanosarcina sp. Mfa9]|uniref:hypothetical protein n=1 Tax=Methanosarcina sp. Mfa9 TaxID=3439063 RepID=UPI003F85F1A2
MAFTTPYETDKHTVYPGDVLFSRLSFAVSLLDDYTKGKPIGRIQVRIKETGKKVIENLSGYYCFTDLEVGNYNVNIRSDLYFPEERTVNTSSFPDPKNPVLEIALKPSPVYPFPENATLLRGVVRDVINVDEPIRNARIKVTDKDVENVTDEQGNFVLYFSELSDEEEVNVEIQKYGYTKTINVAVKELETRSLGIIVFP